jgi:hypothetical protein
VIDVEPPVGFCWRWEGDSVRVELPDLQTSRTHLLEPFLPRADVVQLARAIEAHAPRRPGSSGAEGRALLRRVTVAHDARYRRETVERFSDRFAVALAALGLVPAMITEAFGPAEPASGSSDSVTSTRTPIPLLSPATPVPAPAPRAVRRSG